jgi:hypothetical protein
MSKFGPVVYILIPLSYVPALAAQCCALLCILSLPEYILDRSAMTLEGLIKYQLPAKKQCLAWGTRNRE